MADTVGAWLEVVERLTPSRDAASWDEVGLHVGARDWPVERVLVTLDVTGAVVEEAADGPATLVLAHHPLLFRPLARLTPDTASGRTALAAARAGVAVAAAHTNLDVAAFGTSQPAADVLDLHDRSPLTDGARDSDRVKLVTFVPEEAVDAVLDALAGAGAGVIGDYERCAFLTPGTGTFRPRPGADPYSGRVGEVAREVETRLEVETPRRRVGAVVDALRDAHPYEEVAFDLLPRVERAPGFGVVGRLPEPTALNAVAERLRADLPAPHLRVAGDPDGAVERVAVVGGAGDSLIDAAVARGVDCYITGDLRHHVTLDALEQGMWLIDAGHHATEAAALPAWRRRLADAGRTLTAEVVASAVDTCPWL